MEGFLENFESFIGVNFWTALVTLINFLILFFVAKHFLIGPVMKLIKDRQDEIDGMYSDASTTGSAGKFARSSSTVCPPFFLKHVFLIK